MSTEKVAVVTGSNKGIGFAIVKGLCEKYKGKIYLTARCKDRGNEAIKKLNEMGFYPTFHQLDLDNQDSVNNFQQHIRLSDGGIDLLINNAGIAFRNDATDPPEIQAEVTITTNYFGTVRVCEALFPLLRPNAQVVNVSSSLGHLSKIPSPQLREKFTDPNLNIEKLTNLINQFVKDVKNKKHIENGWGNSMYAVSKVAVNALTDIQQKEFDKDPTKRNISVNSVHPGYVATDMSGFKGPLTVEEGARAALYLSLEQHSLKGQFVWYNCEVVDWKSSEAPKQSY